MPAGTHLRPCPRRRSCETAIGRARFRAGSAVWLRPHAHEMRMIGRGCAFHSPSMHRRPPGGSVPAMVLRLKIRGNLEFCAKIPCAGWRITLLFPPTRATQHATARRATNDPFVYRLGLQIFILARRVRFPYGSPIIFNSASPRGRRFGFRSTDDLHHRDRPKKSRGNPPPQGRGRAGGVDGLRFSDRAPARRGGGRRARSEEHTSELQSHEIIAYAGL